MTVRFEVGMNVACVDANDAPNLTLNAVYVVTEVVVAFQGIGLRVSGAPNTRGLMAYYARRFRPVERTDISDLAKLVVNPPKELVSLEAARSALAKAGT